MVIVSYFFFSVLIKLVLKTLAKLNVKTKETGVREMIISFCFWILEATLIIAIVPTLKCIKPQ